MAIRGIKVRWGVGFQNVIDLNDNINYRGNASDLFAGAENPVVLQQNVWDAPYAVRQQLKERAFTIWVEPTIQRGTDAYWRSVHTLKKRLYSGVLHIYVVRGGDNGSWTWQYIEARCEQLEADKSVFGAFVRKFLAADPLMTVGDPDGTQNTFGIPGPGNPPAPPDGFPLGTITRVQQELVRVASGTYLAGGNPNQVPLDYAGSAPTDVMVNFSLRYAGGPWRYHQDVTITNNAPNALVNHPICIDLGDLRSGIGTYYYEIGSGDHRIRDIRVTTLAGGHRLFYLRDSGDRTGGTWHQSVKLWVPIYRLQPGQSTVLRLRYGNPNADPNEIYPDAGNVKPMFNMYDSTNDAWEYVDFMPRWDQPTERLCQWHRYIPPNTNIAPIDYGHPAFNVNAGGAVVPCAGRTASAYGSTRGAAGLAFYTPVGVASMAYQYRISTNGKLPLVLFWQHRDGRWKTDRVNGSHGYHADSNSVMHSTVLSEHNYVGGTHLYPVDFLGSGGESWQVGDTITFGLNSGNTWMTTITDLQEVVSPYYIVLAAGAPDGEVADAGNPIQQQVTGWDTYYFPNVIDLPLGFAWVLRGDAPQTNCGNWYYGGVEQLTLNFAVSEVPAVVLGPRIDMAAAGRFHLIGTFGNPATNEYLSIDTITYNTYDIVQVDCLNRRVWYFPFNGTSYGAGVNIFECLSFPAVNEHWIHLEPYLSNSMVFLPGPNSNFTGRAVLVDWLTREY